MVDNKIKSLLETCNRVDNGVNRGIEWSSKFVPEDDKKALIKSLKKHKRDLDRLKRTLTMRPSVAIFGQSQVGKSYLVSNLAKLAENDALFIKSGENQLNYIDKINPPGGGKESTGLVSRFTINNTANGLPPFTLKLFNQSDMAKIIANGYLSDINPYVYTIELEEVQKVIKTSKSQKHKEIQPGFSEDEVYELKEYLQNTFGSNTIIRELTKSNYWDEVADIIPYLSFDLRGILLEIIWGKQQFFTDFFKITSEGLFKLDFLSDVYCGEDAFPHNTETILDVERLRELFNNSKKSPVDIFGKNGKIATLDRSIISAITAEVSLPLAKEIADHPSRNFFKQADILDFPGARSRNKIPEQTFTEDIADKKLEVFLRGKVAFLFDRYNYNYEISTLMFCMDNAIPNVTDIPLMIYNWIGKMHGYSPSERDDRERKLSELTNDYSIEKLNPFMVIQTKYNLDLEGNPLTDKIGIPESHNWKWNARLNANFNAFMSQPLTDIWPEKWSNSDGSFKNMFLLRDPKWSNKIFSSKNGKEIEIRDEYREKISDMRQAFLTFDFVKKHFRKPEEAWNESCTIGKDGLDYIVKYMSPTTHPIIRITRIEQLIEEIKQKAATDLEHYYESNDLDKLLKEAKQKSADMFLFFNQWFAKKNLFGELLDSILLKEEEAWSVYYNFTMSPVINMPETSSEKGNDQLTGIKSLFLTSGAEFDESKKLQDNLESLREFLGVDMDYLIETMNDLNINFKDIVEEKAIDSKAQIFAREVIEFWMEKLKIFKKDVLITNMGIPKKIIELLYEILIKTKDRVDLRNLISLRVEPHIKNFAVEGNKDLVAHLTASVVNEYITSLGWKFSDEFSPDYPKIKDKAIFSKVKTLVIKKENIELNIKWPGLDLSTQWLQGVRAAFIANVLKREDMKANFNLAANQALGEILIVINTK